MANRSYLYGFSQKEGKEVFKDFSEWKSAIPLSHKILLSGNPQLRNSYIWSYDEAPIAIVGDYERGVKRLLGFLELLKKQPKLKNQAAFAQAVDETVDYFADPRKLSDCFLLEAAEIFDLSGEPLGPATAELCDECLTIGQEIDRLLSIPNVDVFEETLLATISVLEEDWEAEGGLYWTSILYFHLGKWKL